MARRYKRFSGNSLLSFVGYRFNRLALNRHCYIAIQDRFLNLYSSPGSAEKI